MSQIINNTYITDMKNLLRVLDCNVDIYTKIKPTKIAGKVKPLTTKERKQINNLSKERGYRRFTAEMSNI